MRIRQRWSPVVTGADGAAIGAGYQNSLDIANQSGNTNPRDGDSRFAAQLARGAEPPGTPVEGVMLRWNAIADRTYAVWRTLDLAHTNFDQIATGVPATLPENLYMTPVVSNTPVLYYRIEVEGP